MCNDEDNLACKEHQVRHVYVYIRSSTDRGVSVAHDSLKKDPNMQPRDNVVGLHIHIGVPMYGSMIVHALPVVRMAWNWKIER